MKSKKTSNEFNFINEIFEEISTAEIKKIELRMLHAKKIDEALQEKKWRKKDLKDALNLKSQSIVTKWLSGTHNFTQDSLVEIGEILGINFFSSETMKPQVIEYNITVSHQGSELSPYLPTEGLRENVAKINFPVLFQTVPAKC